MSDHLLVHHISAPVRGTGKRRAGFVAECEYMAAQSAEFNSDPDCITAWVSRFPIKGTTVWHCHMAIHEDGLNSNGAIEMMRPLVIGRKEQKQLPWVQTLKRLNQLVG
ncbi:hypothetical protein [Streptomyces sp. Ag109_O5-1]|uniref:hypothetical protein n=1 Tax=Streptomyces sp. Ag109_O5-1 TaxID=1938851 RepID=UPI000F4D9B5A|nr:hypothetical protein [Streptomyces sp. Ag109_O5-1]